MQFYNTLTRKKEEFIPLDPSEVRMYSCGPTVYDYVHIGNLRSYLFADILRRNLEYGGFKVKQVMNITDIGHLSSDADSGEDKMTKGLLRAGKELTLKNMREMAEFYTEKFKEDLKKLNIQMPEGPYFASDYVQEDIGLVQRLEQKGYTYKTSDGIYFDISKMPDYGALRVGKKVDDKGQSRIGENPEKKHSADFALWKFNPNIGFESPWGRGFPGWHIECSAMGIKFLGEQFDIHTGGIDLIPTHHTNEIAQSESATDKKPFVRFWLHSEHIDLKGERLAKSTGNILKLNDIIIEGINPLAYRLWVLMGHYRTKLNFNAESLEASETALKRLYGFYQGLGEEIGQISNSYRAKFKAFIEDDLDTPKAVALMWDLLKDTEISNADKKATILDFDKVLSLGFENLKEEIIPENIKKLAEEREEARTAKNFKKSDELREKINSLGYEVKDMPEGQKVSRL